MTSCPAAADLTFETTKASADDKIGRRFFLQFSADSGSPGRQSANRFPPQQRASGARRTDLSSTAHPRGLPSAGRNPACPLPKPCRAPHLFLFWAVHGPFSLFLCRRKRENGGCIVPAIADCQSPRQGAFSPGTRDLLRQGRFFFATAWRRCTAPLPPAADRYSIASTLRALAHTWSPTAAQRVPECS